MNDIEFIRPDWPAPANVSALSTTRRGGVSSGVYASFNLGGHVGDDPARVEENRRLLRSRAELPGDPIWLDQVHGCDIVRAARDVVGYAADAAFTSETDVVCAVMTADCLPVLFSDEHGRCVAAAHAGWRGLVSGVLERSVEAMPCEAGSLLAWLGPAIGPDAFEVGEEVRDAFVSLDAGAADCFSRQTLAGSGSRLPGSRLPGSWLADLPGLARRRLRSVGVSRVFGGDLCTHGDPDRFFSYRRDGPCGRLVTAIWLRS